MSGVMETDLLKLKKESFFNKDNSLVDFLVSFINENNPLFKLNELFIKYQKYKTNCPQYIIDENYSRFEGKPDKKEELLELANNMKDLYKKMIDVAYSDEELDDKESDKLKSKITATMPRIKWIGKGNCGYASSLKQNTFTIEDKKTGDTYIFDNFTPTNVRFLRGIITKSLVEAFDVCDNDKPVGTNYIGKCPQCGKIFIKKELRNIYCSTTCSNNLRSQKYRNNQKSR